MPGRRPHKKKDRQRRFYRCPKCQKMLRVHTKRCRTCHQVQPKYL